MDNREWTEWFFTGVPEIGDYIQIDLVHEDTLERAWQEGIIAGNNGSVYWFTWEEPNTYSPYLIEKWRKLIPREFNAVHKERKIPIEENV